MRKVRRQWLYRAREVAREYGENCRELQSILEAQEAFLSRGTGEGIPSGRIGKPVEAEVERREGIERVGYLEQAIRAVELSREEVKGKVDGEITAKMIELLYERQSHTLAGAAAVLCISEETAKRYHRYFLKLVARRMGFLKFPER